MADDAKHKAILFILLAAIAMVLIAAVLPRLKIEPGIPLPGWEESGTLPIADTPNVAISIGTFFKAILDIIVVLVLAFSVYKFIRGVPWKEILRPFTLMGSLATVALTVLFALTKIHIVLRPLEPEILPPALKSNGPPLGSPPIGLIWLVWIGLAVVIVLLGFWIRNWRTHRTRAADSLKREAKRAMQALQTGLDLKSVIVQCYRQMSWVLQREQGIELNETMTAREFERLLNVKGFPYPPVHQLTQLFEVARYGVRELNASDEQDAFRCLNAIVDHSREAGPSH
jgi:hypothetical protein